MKLELFGKNYNPSDSLKAITEKKCVKIARRLDDEDALVKFVVTLENGDYTTDASVTTHGITYRAQAVSGSPFDNVDEVIPKLLGQMPSASAAHPGCHRRGLRWNGIFGPTLSRS